VDIYKPPQEECRNIPYRPKISNYIEDWPIEDHIHWHVQGLSYSTNHGEFIRYFFKGHCAGTSSCPSLGRWGSLVTLHYSHTRQHVRTRLYMVFDKTPKTKYSV
jgi:hypothetical protein